MNNKSKPRKGSAPLLGGKSTKPRTKFRASGDRGTFRVQASIASTLVTTGGAGTGNAAYLMNPGYYPTYISNIAKSYQLFRVARMSFEYVPIVGATTNGAIRVAFLDNPETIYSIVAGGYSAADLAALVFSSTTSVATSVWNGMTFHCPQNRLNRRKWYSIDSTTSSSAEQADRAMPAIGLVTFEGPASTNLGYFMIHFTFEMKDLAAATTTPLFLIQPDDPDVFQGPGGLWWKRVDAGLVQVDPPNTLSCE